MKSFTLLPSVLFIILVGFSACSEVHPSRISLNWNAHSASEACTERDTVGENLEIHRIVDTCAVKYIDDYADYIEAVSDTLKGNPQFGDIGQVLALGAKVSLDELEEIIMNTDYREGYDSLYVMLGIVEGSTELVFALQTAPDPGTGEVNSMYFDFTLPCPTYCPN